MNEEKRKSILDKVNEFFSKNKIQAKVVEDKEEEGKVSLVEFCKDRESHEDYKFEDLPLADGTVVTIEPAVEAGAAIVVMDSEGNPIPAPVGEYELQDGRVIVVAEDGVISEVKEATAEPMEEESKESEDKVKRIIERIESEKIFEKNEELFNKVAELEKTVKFLQDENLELVKKLSETQDFTKQTFETLLEEPSKEPVQQTKKVLPLERNKENYLMRGFELNKKENE